MKSHSHPGNEILNRLLLRRRRAIGSAVVDLLESRVFLSGTLTSYAAFNGTNGEAPVAVVEDSQGNLFGVTSFSLNGSTTESGVLFEIPVSTGQITDLATFGNGSGIVQGTSLVIDSAGNLFGTENGGPAGGGCTIFEVLQGSTTITPLATFPSGDGGSTASQGTLTAVDSSGNLYGIDDFSNAFEVASGSGAISDLASAYGVSQLSLTPAVGPDGNLYGYSNSSIIELVTSTHTMKTLAPFDSTALGSGPIGITFDSNGNLWGMSQYGPGGSQVGSGTVWELPVGASTISLISTFDSTTGENPISTPVFGTSGNLYGLADLGGANQDGTVFEIPGVGSTAAGAVAPTTTPIDLADLDDSDPVSLGEAGIVTDSSGQSLDSAPTTMSSLTNDHLVPAGSVAAASTAFYGMRIYSEHFTFSDTATVFSSGGVDTLTPELLRTELNNFQQQKFREADQRRKDRDQSQTDVGFAVVAGLSGLGLGSNEVHTVPLPSAGLEAESVQSAAQSSYKAPLLAIKGTLNEVAKELNVVTRDLNQQAGFVSPFNKVSTVITSLTTKLAAQTNAAAQAKIQKKLTADQNAQDKILAEDTTVFNATGTEEDMIDTQQSGIDTAFAALPPLVVALSGAVASVPKAMVPGKKAAFALTVTNSGSKLASGLLGITLSARPAGTAGEADIVLPAVSVKIKIKAGAAAKEKFSIVIPTTLPVGSYSLVAQLDPNNVFAESVLPGVIVGVQSFTVT